jgi:protein TonB
MTASVANPFTKSVVLHTGLIAFIVAWSLWQGRSREKWGDPNSIAGGSVAISQTAQIPLPSQRGPVNPVANDTETQTPPPPKVEKKTAEPVKEDPDAVALKSRREKKKQTDIAASNQKYRPSEPKPNQVYSTTGQRAVSPLYGVKGSGGVGTGTGSPLGARFGWYEALLREKVAGKWNTQTVDQSIQKLPEAIVTFVIRRDGSIASVRLVKSSGNYALDTSAQRAIYDAAPFPALPAQFERDSANIEFWFELQR